jgi:hypothetical protein
MSNELTVYDAFKKELEVFKAADAEKQFDVKTPEGYADCKAYHKKLRYVYNRVDELRLSTTASMRQNVKDANTEGNDILAEIDLMANPRKALLDAEDAKEQKVIDDLAEKNRLKAEYEEDERLAWLEYREKAAEAKEAAFAAKEAAAQKIIDDAETKRVADEATAKAVADAVFETERKAHEAKGQLAAKHLQEKNAAKAVIDEADKVKAALAADVTHRTNIHLAIKESVSGYTTNAANADFLVAALAAGRIPNVEIVY